MISLPQFDPKIIALLLCLSISAWNGMNGRVNPRVIELKHGHHDLELISNARSDSENIRLAKRLLGLREDAPKGVLLHTYMMRLYNVPENATRGEMAEIQMHRDMHYNHAAEGVPDWFPDFLITERINLKCNLTGPMVSKWISGLDVFASQAQFQANWAKRVLLEKELCRKTGTPFSWEELDRKLIVAKLGLKPSTSYDEASEQEQRIVRLL